MSEVSVETRPGGGREEGVGNGSSRRGPHLKWNFPTLRTLVSSLEGLSFPPSGVLVFFIFYFFSFRHPPE